MDDEHINKPIPKPAIYTPRRRRTLGTRDLRRVHRGSSTRLSLKQWAKQVDPHEFVGERHGYVLTAKAASLVGKR